MQLTWIPSRRRFIGTQTEAKAEKVAFEAVDVPLVKADLMAYLNEREERHEAEIAALRAELGNRDGADGENPEDAQGAVTSEASSETEAPAAAAVTREARPDGEPLEIDYQVMELDHKMLIRVLSAAIGRLGELAGTRGWAAFAKDVYGWSPSARNVEQGLGMLMLAAFDSFGMDKTAARTAPTPIQPPDPRDRHD